MSDKRRPYRKTVRAEKERETRLRLTESAVVLHGTVGPAETSMSAIAEHAGVQRSTLYRHFPDETAIFAACSAHWAMQNPLPDVERWARIQDPVARLRLALNGLYEFYARNEQMLANVHRDRDAVPVMRELMDGWDEMMRGRREVLMAGRSLEGAARRRVRAAIGHALAFSTWQSLVTTERLGRKQAVEMMEWLIERAG